jgi:hypothetical protein
MLADFGGREGYVRRGPRDSRLLELWVRIPPWAWMSVSCNVVCCQVEVSATGRSLVQRSLNVACLSVVEETHRGGLGPLGLMSYEKNNLCPNLK